METVHRSDIADWIRTYLGELVGVASHEIDLDASFDQYGVDSTAAAGMAGDLGRWLNIDLQPTFWDAHPSIGTAVAALCRRVEEGGGR